MLSLVKGERPDFNADPVSEPCRTPGCSGMESIRYVLNVRIPVVRCPTCKEIQAKKDAEIKRQNASLTTDRMFIDADFPRRYKAASLSSVVRWKEWPGGDALMSNTYVATTDAEVETVHRLRRWLMEPSGWIVLAGEKGRGKSLLAAGLLADVLRQGRPGRWLSWEWLASGLDAAYGSEEYERVSSAIALASSSPFTVLDDVGVSAHKRATSTLKSIVSIRYEHLRPTVLTTNLTQDGLGAAFGEAVASRILEECQKGAWLDHRGPGFNVRFQRGG